MAKPLSKGPSVESEDFPERFSETWEPRSASNDDSERTQTQERGVWIRIKRRLPCRRCWTSLVASAAITAFIVGGVLIIVALLVKHHDEQMEKLERDPAVVVSHSTQIPPKQKVFASDNAINKSVHAVINRANFCDSLPCQNGGTCLVDSNGASCLCPFGFSGRLCAIKELINPSTTTAAAAAVDPFCASRICSNGGVCNHALKQCDCPANFSGRFCQNFATGECRSSPCLFDSTCVQLNNGSGFKCLCPAGMSGRFCEKVICGSTVTLIATPKPDVISSPDFPNDRLPMLNCYWTITARYYYIKFSIEDIFLAGDDCNASAIDLYDNSTQALLIRYCPRNASKWAIFESRRSRSVDVRYSAQPGSFFRLNFSSPNVDPCFYFNNASCLHGKCWPDESKATCVCNPCYRGVGCSEIDKGDCTDSFCENGGTCVYNCYVQTKQCQCAKGYDPGTNCKRTCSVNGGC